MLKVTSDTSRSRRSRTWLARLAVAAIFAVNVSCALSFLLWPERYVPGFEISGVPGRVLVQGLGILFLMWNATYPPVIAFPDRHRWLFAVVLVQQVIGLVGETWLWFSLPEGHAALRATGLRFIAFDAVGLILMGAAFAALIGPPRDAPRQQSLG